MHVLAGDCLFQLLSTCDVYNTGNDEYECAGSGRSDVVCRDVVLDEGEKSIQRASARLIIGKKGSEQ